MKNEADYKRWMVKQVQEAGGYARRIEDQFAVGTLDMVFVLPRMPVIFAEAKLVKGAKFAPTERQYIEMQRIDAASGNAVAILIGCRPDVISFSLTTREARITDPATYHCESKLHFADMLSFFMQHKGLYK